jgi:putative transposase
MPRQPRRIEAGIIYHVLNRGNGRRTLFAKDGDYLAFLTLLGQALERFPVDLLAYCLMGNHWHLLLRPRKDDALWRMMAWMTVTHARRHHKHYPNPGSGHLYQGRFKSFPVQSDEHFLIVARYIHANPIRAGLVKRTQNWAWSDLMGSAGKAKVPLADWPVDRPKDWLRIVNEPQEPDHVEAIQTSFQRGAPFGGAQWVKRIARRLNLGSTLRPPGRPRRPMNALSARQRRRRLKELEAGGHKSNGLKGT